MLMMHLAHSANSVLHILMKDMKNMTLAVKDPINQPTIAVFDLTSMENVKFVLLDSHSKTIHA